MIKILVGVKSPRVAYAGGDIEQAREVYRKECDTAPTTVTFVEDNKIIGQFWGLGGKEISLKELGVK